jgi:hypothetical protein
MPDLVFKRSSLDVTAVVALLERAVEQEKIILETHKALNDPMSYLKRDYEVTQTEILLTFLSRHC